jgi:hypothetical protein
VVVLQLRERPTKQIGLETRIVQAEVIGVPPDAVTLAPASSPAIEDLASSRFVKQELSCLGLVLQVNEFNGQAAGYPLTQTTCFSVCTMSIRSD